MRLCPSSWRLRRFTMDTLESLAFGKSRTIFCPSSTNNIVITSPTSMVRSLQLKSYITEQTATSSRYCTRMESGLHPIWKLTKDVQLLEAKDCARVFATMIANFAHRSTSGIVATCMALAFIWLTWLRRATGIFQSPKLLMEDGDIA